MYVLYFFATIVNLLRLELILIFMMSESAPDRKKGWKFAQYTFLVWLVR